MPVIRRGNSSRNGLSIDYVIVDEALNIDQKIGLVNNGLPSGLKQEEINFYLGRKEALEKEYSAKKKDVFIERAKISNKARERWQSGADRSELKEYYDDIQVKTEQLGKLTELIEHIEKFGELPSEQKAQDPSMDILSMKERKRQLINQRDKLRRNLRPNAKQPKNSERRSHWEQTLALLDAEYDDLVQKINKKNYESRDIAGQAAQGG